MDEVEKLINNLTSDRSRTRTDAAFELGRRREGRAVEPLIKALQDDHEFVREAAARALGKIRDKRAEQPLSEALKDPETAVANAAAEALRALGVPIEEPEIKQEVQVKEVQVKEEKKVVVPTKTKVILAALALIVTVICGALPLLQVAGLIVAATTTPGYDVSGEPILSLGIVFILIAWGVIYTRILKRYTDKS